jgi:glycosyltransferase involved in cell wall biosynthesis
MSITSEVCDQRSVVSACKSDPTRQQKQLSALNRQLSTSHRIALLTGGSDRPYVLGLVEALTSVGSSVDVIGSDELTIPDLLDNSRVNFLNLRGDQSPDAPFAHKIARVLAYYARLICYAATAKPKVFHILWNNKFELFDRTLLLLYYKAVGRRVVLTAHNVNMRKRDGTDSWLNRLSLRIQYQVADQIFVHTGQMKAELMDDFGIADTKITVIPFGINNTSPTTDLSCAQAKERLGLSPGDKAVLCFGQIAPYKGLEYLVGAFAELARKHRDYRLIIAGKPKWNAEYWSRIEQLIIGNGLQDRVIERIGHVPDTETEVYFKAADVLVLPYTNIFQSGVVFLAYNFGLPVIAADVGSLKENIVEGRTGFVFRPRDSADLANKIEQYFNSELFTKLGDTRADIKAYANECYSWAKVVAITTKVYGDVVASAK